MSLVQILVYTGFAALIGVLLKHGLKRWAIFILSLLSVYIFQPLVPLRNFDYWFPTLSIAITVGSWFILFRRSDYLLRENLIAGGFSIFIVVGIALVSRVPVELPWLPGSAPSAGLLLVFIAAVSALTGLLSFGTTRNRAMSWFLLLLLIVIFIFIKAEPIWLAERLRAWQGQSTALASVQDLNWLGFSYLSFRLIHTIRDHQTGRLPETNLRDYVSYVLFFPAIVAGPIDRIERFLQDLGEHEHLDGERVQQSGRRIVLGLFKKFIIADGLALFALNAANAEVATSTIWTWALLYSYSFRLFFDFSGYTDIAIGLGLLTGVRLPENFDRPYLKSNLTAFWNSWHITLARWFRTYFFNPLTRWLRSGPLTHSTGLIILLGQLSTMVLIGLWHGITWNFAIWGLWHGIGLFVHNRWLNYIRTRTDSPFVKWVPERIRNALGVALTFQFTTLGWVWFALPGLELSLNTLRVLAGLQVVR